MEGPMENRPPLLSFSCDACGRTWSSINPQSICEDCFQVHLRDRIPDLVLLEVKSLIRNDQKVAAIHLVKSEMGLSLQQAVTYVTALAEQDAG